MSRYIDEISARENFQDVLAYMGSEVKRMLKKIPTADVVEVRRDFSVGDFCLYGFADGNKSLAIVEIVKILDDAEGIAELKFHISKERKERKWKIES